MPKIVDHDEQRRQLVAQAWTLFAQRGYAALGMREIAKELQVSKSALYHYFPSKEALFEAVVQTAVEADFSTFTAYDRTDATPHERLQIIIDYCQEHEQIFTQQLLILFDYVREKTAEQIRAEGILPQMVETYVSFFADYLDISPTTAHAINIFLNGLFLQRLIDGTTSNYQALTAWLVHVIEPELKLAQHNQD